MSQNGMMQGNYGQGYPMKAHVGGTQGHFTGGPPAGAVPANSEAATGPSPPTTHRPSFSGAPPSSASAPASSLQPHHSSQSNPQGTGSTSGYPTSAEAYSFWQQQQQYHQQQLLQQQQAQQQHHASQHMSLQYQQQHAQHMAAVAQSNPSQNPSAYPSDAASYHSANLNYPPQYSRSISAPQNAFGNAQMGPNGPNYGNGQQFASPAYYQQGSGQTLPNYSQSTSNPAMQGMFQNSLSQGGHASAQQMPSQLSQYAGNSQLGSAHMQTSNTSASSSAAVAMRSQQQQQQQQQFQSSMPNAAMSHPSMAHYANNPQSMSHGMSSYGYQHAAAAAQMAARGQNGMMMHPGAAATAGGHPGMANVQYGSMGSMQAYNSAATARDQAMYQQQQRYAAAMAANAAAAAAAASNPSSSYGSHHPNAAQRAIIPSAPLPNPHEDEDDDGEVINSKALAKAESAQNRSKKKRKREGDDDDDEDFTGAEDVDWQPESRRSAASKRNKRRGSSDWDEPYGSGSTDHLGRASSMPPSSSQNDADSLVSTRPRRERRTSFKFREGYDFGDDEDIFEEDDTPTKSKGRAKRKASISGPSAAAHPASASSVPVSNPSPSWQQPQAPSAQPMQFYQQPDASNVSSLSSASAPQLGGHPSTSLSFSEQPQSKLSASAGASGSINRSHTEDEDSSEFYGADGDEEADGEEGADDGPVIDKVLDYREYVDEDEAQNSTGMNQDGSPATSTLATGAHSSASTSASAPAAGSAATSGGSAPLLKNVTRAMIRGDMSAVTKTDKQYRIKWKGSSFMHCTWEAYDALVGVRGFKKVENYIKGAIKECQWRRAASREELELHDIEQEMLQDLFDEHLKVDRVIAYRKPEPTEDNPKPSPEYLCVWSKLPYVDATWERAEEIAPYQRKIDQYLNRSQQQLIPRTFYGSRIQRPSFREVQLLQTTPTEWLKGGMLRDYQLQGINWLVFSWCNSTNCILADEMGLGKTIQTLSFLGFLQFRQQIPGPFLIVVPLSTIANWEAESAKWLPDMNTVVYIGDSKSRELIREHEFWYRSNGKLMTKFNTLITSYEIILKDKQHLGSIKWNFLAVDEAHRLKNADSALHEVLNDFTTSSRLLITGTPLQNSLKELWALLNFLEPRLFPSLDLFEREYSKLEGEGQLAALHHRLKPHVLRRFKSQVEKSLPAKNERILRVGMAPIQRKYYRWIINRNFAELNRGLRGQEMRTLSNIVVELKKVCNHPFLFPNAEEQARTLAFQQALDLADPAASIANPDGTYPPVSPETQRALNEAMLDTLIRSSGKLMLLDRLLLRLKETGHRVLIFSQMVRMLDLLSEYLRLRAFQFQRLDGSMSRSARQMAMESFNAEGSKDFCFILSTRAGGLGINLATADTVIIFDSDWNPQNDLQAQSRAHRIGQKHVVNIYRLMVKNTVEEDILERAKKKLVLDHLVIQRMSTGKSSHYQAAGAAGGGPVPPQGPSAGPQSASGSSSAAIFSKNELAEIIKFGAEDLFKARDDDQFDAEGNPIVNGTVKSQLLDDMDIDDILERAEPAPEEIQPGFELLSAFKVASFDTGTEDEDEKEEPATPAKGRRRGKSESNPNADFWERIIPAELRIDRVPGSDMIVTGPRARKKRIDLSAEISEPSSHHHSSKDPPTTPQRPRSTRKAKSAATDAIHESLTYADHDGVVFSSPTSSSAAVSAPGSGGAAGTSNASASSSKRSPRPRAASASGQQGLSASAASAASVHSATEDAYFSGDEDDAGDDDGLAKSGDANGAASGEAKKKVRSRKGEKKRAAAGEGEMDASDVRKLLQTIRTWGCDDITKVIQHAGLTTKWPGIVETTLNDIVAQCRTCIEEATKGASSSSHLANSNSSLSHGATGSSMDVDGVALEASSTSVPRLSASTEGAGASGAAGEESKGPKTTIKYLDVSINAVQLLTRLSDMSDLAALVKPYADPYAFRLAVVVKNWAPFASLWSSPIDDAMLLLGAYLYGFGQWTRLSSDPKLNLEAKIFAAGQPTAAQLNTRAESLLKALRDSKSSKSGGSSGGSSNPMTDIADLEMPTRRKRSSSTKQSTAAPSAIASTNASGDTSSQAASTPLTSASNTSNASANASNASSAPIKPKAPKRRKTAAEKAESGGAGGGSLNSAASNPNAAAAQAELASYDAELQARVASVWEPTQTELRDSYTTMSAMPDSDAKFVAYHRFLVALRAQVHSLTEYYWVAMTDATWTREQLQACLWAHAAVHICGGSRTGLVIQGTADHYAKSPPPPLNLAQPHPSQQQQHVVQQVTHIQLVPGPSVSSSPAPIVSSSPASSASAAAPSAASHAPSGTDHRVSENSSVSHDDYHHYSQQEDNGNGADEDDHVSSPDHRDDALMSFEASEAAHQNTDPEEDAQESSIGMDTGDIDGENRDDLGDSPMDLDAPQSFEEPDLNNDDQEEADSARLSLHSSAKMDEDPRPDIDLAHDDHADIEALEEPSSPSFHDETGVDDSELETMMNEADQSSVSLLPDDITGQTPPTSGRPAIAPVAVHTTEAAILVEASSSEVVVEAMEVDSTEVGPSTSSLAEHHEASRASPEASEASTDSPASSHAPAVEEEPLKTHAEDAKEDSASMDEDSPIDVEIASASAPLVSSASPAAVVQQTSSHVIEVVETQTTIDGGVVVVTERESVSSSSVVQDVPSSAAPSVEVEASKIVETIVQVVSKEEVEVEASTEPTELSVPVSSIPPAVELPPPAPFQIPSSMIAQEPSGGATESESESEATNAHHLMSSNSTSDLGLGSSTEPPSSTSLDNSSLHDSCQSDPAPSSSIFADSSASATTDPSAHQRSSSDPTSAASAVDESLTERPAFMQVEAPMKALLPESM